MLIRDRALVLARKELGVHEVPAGSNWGPRVKQYLASAGLTRPAPWCMAFVNWCYRQAGLDIKHPNEASVGFFEQWARQNGYLVSKPEPGDIVCYRFDSDSWPDHVGLVEKVRPDGSIETIEGNTGIGNDANGGIVMRRSRSARNCKFARIPGATKLLQQRVDVTVDGQVRLRRQLASNPAVLRRIGQWMRGRKRVVINPSR